MFVDKDAPHKHYPMLRCNAKEADWFCRALAFVWAQYCEQTNLVHTHISQTLRLAMSLYDIVGARAGLFHVPEGRELILKTAVRLIAHYSWLAKWAHNQGLKR
jgi:hypothetical protein